MLYINNAMDFSFEIFDLWRYMIPLAFVAFVLSWILMIAVNFINEEAHTFLQAIYLSVLLALFIQGNFLTEGIPLLDGSSIDWNQNQNLRFMSIVVWGGSFLQVFVIYIAKKFMIEKSATIVGSLFIAYLVITLALSCLTSKTAFVEKTQTTMTADGMLEMSENNNFVFFLLDAIDERAFEDVLENNPKYENSLEDFTLFTNTMCLYPHTTRSVPYILFGKEYNNSIFYPLYLKEAIRESPFIQRLTAEHFDQRVYFEYLYLTEIPNSVFQNFVDVRNFKNPELFCKMIIKLTGLQYLPYDLKKFCVLTPDNIYFDTLKTSENENLDYYSFDNLDLFNRIANNEIELTEKNCFRFLYAQGAHVPWSYSSDLKPVDSGTYSQAIESSLTLIDCYLNKLKEKNVYDNSVIIILSDHGWNTENKEDIVYHKQNPILMIKGLNEKHMFEKNDAPISHEDLQQAYLRLLDGCVTAELFDWHEGDYRERNHYISEVIIEADIFEYISDQHASDYEALKPSGRVYPFDWDTVIMEETG